MLVTLTGAAMVHNDDIRMPPLADNSTYGNIDQIRTEHLQLYLDVDFDNRTLSGVANHVMDVVAETDIAQFDVWNLSIESVADGNSSAALNFTVSSPNPKIGSVLQVKLGRTVQPGEQVILVIAYSTSPTGQAFSWLNAE